MKEKSRYCDECAIPVYLTSSFVLHLWPDGKWLCEPCQEVRLLKEDKDEVRWKVHNQF